MSRKAIMTLAETITAVPLLGSTCSLALMDSGSPGSGIKLLRLVSKHLRMAMLGVVRGYTLALNGHGGSIMKEMALLQGTRLSCLRVVVSHEGHETSPGGLNGWESHTLHLRCLISGMGSAIRDITRLEVDASLCEGSAEAVAVLLSQLAPACPALQQLNVEGDIGRGLLSALGAACSKLSCLEVVEGMAGDALQQLHLVLPGLTQVKIPTSVPADGSGPSSTQPFCLALLSCTSLTSLDVGVSILTTQMWQALPTGLRELCCSLDGAPPAGLRLMGSLEHFQCFCHPAGNHTCLGSLVSLLQMAPNLKHLRLSGHGGNLDDGSSIVSEVYSDCALSSIQDLVYLNHRVFSGLSFTSTLCVGQVDFPGVNLSLFASRVPADNEDAAQGLGQYLAALPPLPAFTGLALACGLVWQNVSALARGMATVFPNLKALHLSLPGSVSSRDLQHFGSFTALQHLSLEEADVSPPSLAVLCTRMPSLQSLRLKECEGFSSADGEDLQVLLSDWGSAAKVVVIIDE